MRPDATIGQNANQPPNFLDHALYVGCLVPIVAAVGLASWVTASLLHWLIHLPMWLSIPLGLVGGGLFIGFVKLGGNNTVVELSVTCAICAIVMLILMSTFRHAREFRQAREHARWQRQRAARSAWGTTRGAHYAGPPVSARSGTRR